MHIFRQNRSRLLARIRQLLPALLLAGAGIWIVAAVQPVYAQVGGGTGTINVTKTSSGGDDTFPFVVTDPASGTTNLPITTASGTGLGSLTTLGAGAYVLSENVPAGWVVSSINCTVSSGGTSTFHIGDSSVDPDPTYNGVETQVEINLVDGETVDCRFNNSRPATITVVKSAAGASAPNFSFTSSLPAPNDSFALAPSGSQVFVINPGAFFRLTIAEVSIPSPWVLSNIECVANAGPGTFDYQPATGSNGTGFDAGDSQVVISGYNGNSDITCTFTNEESVAAGTGTVTIEKTAAPDDGTQFDFTVTDSNGAQGGSTNGSGSTSAFTVQAGTVTVAETAIVGWTQSAFVCRDANGIITTSPGAAAGSVEFTVAADDDITCAVTNTKVVATGTGTVTIEKTANPDDGTQFDFTVTDSNGAQGGSTNGSGSTGVFTVQAGTVTVAEAAVVGWMQGTFTCFNGGAAVVTTPGTASGSVDFAVAADDDITCAVINTKDPTTGTVEIEKTANPDDGTQFDFTVTDSNGAQGGSTNGSGSTGVFTVEPGTVTVAETAVVGWSQGAFTCFNGGVAVTTTPGTAPGSIEFVVAAGDDITCTVTNTEDVNMGQVTVVKTANPDDGTQFDFTVTDSNGAQSGSATGSGTVGVFTVQPGTVDVTETAVAGWTLDSFECRDASGSITITTEPSTGAARFAVAAGDAITCEVTNTKIVATGTIEIVKLSMEGVGVDATFGFTSDISGAGSFGIATSGGSTMSNGQGSTSFAVTPGSYIVAEDANALYELTDITCADPTDDSTTNLATGIANIDVAAGETVRCTYTNRKLGRLIIKKATIGGDDTFEFTGELGAMLGNGGSANTLITPGTYDVTESVQDGWALTDIVCGDGNSTGDIGTGTATYIISVGEQVECTFTNTKLGAVVITKMVVPSGATGSFDFTSDLVPTISIDAGMVYTISDVLPGTFTLTEIATAGWDLTDLSCIDPSGGTTIDLADGSVALDVSAGETISCEFENTQYGTINIVKETLPDGDTTAFTFSGDFSGTLQDGGSTSLSVPAGAYAVTEETLAGWALTGISCVDSVSNDSSDDISSRTATINVDAGEVVTCTFTNTKDGAIRVSKVTAPAGSSTAFGFSGDITASLSDGQSSGLVAVAPGSYNVIEAAASGWQLTDIQCDDDDSSGTVAANEANFVVAPGEEVACVFTNTMLDVAISLDKEMSANADNDGSGTITLNDVLTYTFAVENVGAAPLSSIVITDSMVSSISCPQSTLAVAESMICSATYTVTQPDVDLGEIVNNASVRGEGPEGDETTDDDTVTTDIPQTSSLDLVKNLRSSGLVALDSLLTYEFVVTNNSNVTLEDITVSDQLAGLSPVDCAPQTNGSIVLAPRDQIICTATYTVTQTDVNNGVINNTALATGNGPNGSVEDPGSETTDIVRNPSIALIKNMAGSVDADGSGSVSDGDTLTYTFDVTNDGNVTLDNVKVTDPLSGLSVIDCAPLTNGSIILQPTESVTCTATYVVTADDAAAGQIDNVANAGGDADGGETPSDTDQTSTPIGGVNPDIEATKVDGLAVDADGDGFPSPGDTLIYTVTISSTGNFTATNVFLTDTPDPNTTLVTGTVTTTAGTVTTGNSAGDTVVAVPVGDLGVDQQAVVTFHVMVSSTVDPDIVLVANQGFVVHDGESPQPTDDPDTMSEDGDPTQTSIVAKPLIDATKIDRFIDSDGNGMPSPGDEIEYTITVSNNGNQAGLAAFVNDPLDPNTTLIVDSVTSSQGSILEGNQAGDANIEIDLGPIAPQDDIVIVFRVRINNPLPTGVTTVANQGFVRGDNFTTVPTNDPDTKGLDSTETPVTATPSVSATKSAALSEDRDGDGVVSPGDILTYNVRIVNSGNTAADSIVFTDNPDQNTTLLPGSVSSTQGAIAIGNGDGDGSVVVNVGTLANPNDSVEILFQVRINSPLVASVQQVENQGLVTGGSFPPVVTDDPNIAGDMDATVTALNSTPVLRASKSDTLFIDSDGDGVPSPGDTLLYEVTISNIGNGNATNVVFEDTVDPNTSIIPGTVQSSQGSVLTGNASGDTSISIAIGSIPDTSGQAKISFRVMINSPIAAGTASLINQGVVRADGNIAVDTDDPDLDGDSDPTETLIQSVAQLTMTKEDFLITDNDKDVSPELEGPSADDTLLYVVTIANNGNAAATNVVFNDTPDANTTLIAGTVQASVGAVAVGNSENDTNVIVNIESIPAGENVSVGFSVTINDGVGATSIFNQASLSSDGVSGTAELLSTDPDASEVASPTVTILSTVPTALDVVAEPLNNSFSSYLPITVR